MKEKEAKARIEINKLLEESGWRFYDSKNGKSNIQLECNVKITNSQIDSLGEDFEKVENGFVDYLLLDEIGNPFIIVEAKSSSKHPLDGKEQARKYAISLRVNFIILSNGTIHYFWNISKGEPEVITKIPSFESLKNSKANNVNVERILNEKIDKYYIAVSQDPSIQNHLFWKNNQSDFIDEYCQSRDLRILRDYQVNAINSIKSAVSSKKMRFLFEMATGTGKTLTSAGVIKLFFRSELVNRVLFLVDRLELENQAKKDLRKYLSKDGYKVVVFKENKDDWHSADVVISTAQSISFDNKYQRIFSPSDFDLVISDEAHRSLGASNRAILEYFLGYKLGLTATPKNYLKGVNFDIDDPREIEKRILLDTYHIFGCDSGSPTFSYTLSDGVADGVLINPIIIDARSDVTTELLSENGLTIELNNDDCTFNEGDVHVEAKSFTRKDFERSFYSDSTNRIMCQTFIENSLKDPFTSEVGKSIIFCVNIKHAQKVTQILNEISSYLYPGKYNSDFAVQITSNIYDAQQMTINFANNRLNGKTTFIEDYNSSKTRVVVTVGMMTTGYDCQDILNICLFRPVFSPTEFIQIKGRGTRIFSFKNQGLVLHKEHYYLFDFFAVCEFFENDFKYDEKIDLPNNTQGLILEYDDPKSQSTIKKFTHVGTDKINTINITEVSDAGMKIDQMFYKNFSSRIESDVNIQKFIKEEDESAIERYLVDEVFDKPTEYFSISKLERSLGLDRKLTLKEIVHFLLGKITRYKTKQELIDDEFNNFILVNKTEIEKCSLYITSIRFLFSAYLLDESVRKAVKEKKLQDLLNSPLGYDLRKTKDLRIRGKRLLDYIYEYVIIYEVNYSKFA